MDLKKTFEIEELEPRFEMQAVLAASSTEAEACDCADECEAAQEAALALTG